MLGKTAKLLTAKSLTLPFEEPVFVQSKELDLGCLPDWRAILEDLPVGVGVKGGIARKILKVISGLNGEHPDFAAEMDGNGDIDILIAVPEVSSEIRLRLRHLFTGYQFGNMEVMAKDIEVCDSLERYFRVRDVTMNEVLAFRVAPNLVVLYFTAAAQADIKSGLISPSIHCPLVKRPRAVLWDSHEHLEPLPGTEARPAQHIPHLQKLRRL